MSLNLGNRFRYDAPHHNLIFENNLVGSITIWLVVDGGYHVLPTLRSGESLMPIPINSRVRVDWKVVSNTTFPSHQNASGGAVVALHLS
jgi:hypothetical protein